MNETTNPPKPPTLHSPLKSVTIDTSGIQRFVYPGRGSSSRRIFGFGFVVLLLVFLLAGCGSSGPVEDASAILACDHFRNVMGDIGNGILSDAEIRDKMKQVYSDAQSATTPGITDNARMMLADATQGNKVNLLGDATAFSNDCKSIGH